MWYMDQHGGRHGPFKCYVMPWGDGVYGSARRSLWAIQVLCNAMG